MTSHKIMTIIVTSIIIYNTIVRICIFRAGCIIKGKQILESPMLMLVGQFRFLRFHNTLSLYNPIFILVKCYEFKKLKTTLSKKLQTYKCNLCSDFLYIII